MAPRLEFENRVLYPAFRELPEEEEDDGAAVTTTTDKDWCLLAQIKDDMTINKPTLVLFDRDDAPFALVFEGLGRDDLDFKALGLKKGATIVVARARRTRPTEEGKRGFVRIPEGRAVDVRAVPGPLERVFAAEYRLHAELHPRAEARCEACGKDGEGLSKCTGCGKVRYCSKACQANDWLEVSHKMDCRIFKALNSIWK